MTLVADESWKKVQQTTFTNWVNNSLRGHLKKSERHVEDLSEGLRDGLTLIQLLETVAHSKVGRHNHNPRFKAQMMENLETCFNFLEKEKIKVVNIGPVDIYNGELKLIMGLIWTLIRRYQIRSTGRDLSTKAAMLAWVNTQIPEQKIKNFTTNWNDGVALCALVDRVQPGVCPQYGTLDRSNKLSNCSLGMKLSEEKLNIPKVLEPEDLCHPEIDEISVMTYISYFCKPANEHLLHWVQTKLPDRNITNFQTDWNNGINLACLIETLCPGTFPNCRDLDPHSSLENLVKAMKVGEDHLGVKPVIKPSQLADPSVDELNVVTYLSRFQYAKPIPQPHEVTCSGNGLYKAFVGRAAVFDVDATKGGVGELKVLINAKGGSPVVADIKPQKRTGMFEVRYIPHLPGRLSIEVQWSGFVIPASPFSVDVLDPGALSFTSKQITGGQCAKVGKTVVMEAKGLADVADLYILIQHPDGHTETAKIVNKGSGMAECSYTPVRVGKDEIFAKIAGTDIPGSPFEVKVVDPNLCSVSQHDPPPGKPLLVDSKVTLAVIASGVNADGIVAEVKSPSGLMEMPVVKSGDGPNFSSFTPVQIGKHEVLVTCGGENIRGSPITLNVGDPSKCAFLDAIPRYVQLSKPSKVNLSTKGAGPGSIEIQSSQPGVLRGESKQGAESDLHQIELIPSAVGESTLTVKWNGQTIDPTPKTVFVCDATHCSAYGPGLTSGKGKMQEPFTFTVQAKDAGRGELTVKPRGPKTVYAADISKNSDDTYSVSFTSFEEGPHEIDVLWGGEHIPNSPYKVNFSPSVDVSKISVRGSGLDQAIANRRAEVTVYARESKLIEKGALKIAFKSASGSSSEIPEVDIYDNENGSYSVSYTPKAQGTLVLTVSGEGEQVVGSPFNINVHPEPNAGMCTIQSRSGANVFGSNSECYQKIGQPLELAVDTTRAGTGSLDVSGRQPDQSPLRIFATDEKQATKKLTLLKFDPTSLGTHHLSVTWDQTHIPRSPFKIHVVNPDVCKPKGDFPSYVKLNSSTSVSFSMSQCGPGQLAAKCNDSIVRSDVSANTVTLTGVRLGKAKVHVTFGGYDIPGSPFSLSVCDPSKCSLDAASLEGQQYLVGVPFTFNVIATAAGPGKLQVKPTESSHNYNIEVKNVRNGTWKVNCTPWSTGEQALTLLWGDWEISGSPLRFAVSDPKKVLVKDLPDPKTYVPILGEPLTFTIDYSQAGEGSLTTIARLEDGEEKEIEREETDSDSKVAALQFVPSKPGKLELVLKFNGVNILPAVCLYEVPDPSRFQVTHPKGYGKIKEYVKFPVTGVTKDTDLNITAVHADHNATVKTEPGKDENTVIARFTAKHTGEYAVQVKHKGQDVAGSPFTVQIANPDACKPKGELPSVVHLGDKAEFEIDTSEGGPGEILFQTEALSGEIQPEIAATEDNKHTISLEEGTGNCRVSIKWADYVIPSTPFTVSFVDSGQVQWSSDKEYSTVKQGEVVILTVDCTKAGQATPEVKAIGPQSEFPSQQKDNKDGTFTVTLNPWQVGENSIEIYYGGHLIPNTPLKFEVVKPIEARTITATGAALERMIAGEPAGLTINTPDPGLLERGVLKAKFLSEEDLGVPSIELKDAGDGKYDVTLLSENEGDFSLDISCNDTSILGSPFKIRVKAPPRSENCSAFGPALEKNARLVVDDPVKFSVDSTDAGTGKLDVSAMQPNDKSIQVYQNNETGERILHHLKFDPEIIGLHVVKVTWEGVDIPGSPFEFNIVDPSKVHVNGLPPEPNGLAYINEPLTFSVTMKDSGAEFPKVYIDPPGDDDIAILSGNPISSSILGYQYTPTRFGDHLVSIEVGGIDILGSPFKVNVIDPSKFSIAALSLKGDYALVCEMVSIYIHGNASEGDTLTVTAHGPSADLNVETEDIGEGRYKANFVPIEPGCYEVFVEYAGTHVNGSPFTVNVADPSKCQVLGDIPKVVQVGKSEEFTVKTRGAGVGSLKALINDQEKHPSVKCEVVDQRLDTYSVILTGNEVDEVSLDLLWAEFQIPQSPFTLNVCDANKCKAFGQALVSKKGKAGEAINFSVVSENAGKGKLTVVAKGPSAQYTVDVKELKEDTHEVTFTPWEIGEHTVEVQWGNRDIPKSPFIINVGNPMDSSVCNATGEGLKVAIAGHKATFMIISSDFDLLEKNALKVSVLGVQSHAEVLIKDNNNGSYSVEYVAPTPGAYVGSVSYYDRQIPGSPFKINVHPGPDASKCFAYGPALNQNSILIAGSPLELFVDTTEGGHGQLRVYIQGPNDYHPKVFLADDSKGVYSIKFDAMKAGKYFIVVAWSEEHIPGSPFKLKVHPAADASMVKAYGPGLIDGFLGAPGQFTVETRRAGVGTLLIRVHGLKDSFRIEAHPLSKDNPRTLFAAYNPMVKGNYVVFVRWSGNHVPGSPFNVTIRPKPGTSESEVSEEVKSKPIPPTIQEITPENVPLMDDSFAKATPKYEGPQGKKRDSKPEKQRRSRPQSKEVKAPPGGMAGVGPVGPKLKMKENPGMAMAMAQSRQPEQNVGGGMQIRRPTEQERVREGEKKPEAEEKTSRRKALLEKRTSQPKEKVKPEAKKDKQKVPSKSPPHKGAARSKSPPPKGAARSKSPPPKGAVRSKSPPPKDAAHSKSPPPKGAARSKSPPPKGAARSKSPPPKGAARSKSPPPKGAVRSKSPPPKGAARSKSPPPKDTARSKSPPPKDAAHSKSPPPKEATPSKIPPPKEAASSKSPPPKEATPSKSPPPKEALSSKSPPPKSKEKDTKSQPPSGKEAAAPPEALTVEQGSKVKAMKEKSEARPKSPPPKEGAVRSKSSPPKGAARSKSPPSKGAARSKSPPPKGATRSKSPPPKGAARSKSPPPKGAARSKSPPPKGAARSKSPPPKGKEKSKGAPKARK